MNIEQALKEGSSRYAFFESENDLPHLMHIALTCKRVGYHRLVIYQAKNPDYAAVIVDRWDVVH